MYSEQQFEQLEQEERVTIEEYLLVMFLLLDTTKGNLEKELRNFYQKYGKDGVVTYSEARKWISEQDHRRRLTALNLLVNDEFHSTLDKLKVEFKEMLKSTIDKEVDFFDTEIDVDKTLDTPWGVDETTWSERLENDVLLWIAYICADLKRSLLQRVDLTTVLERMDKRFKKFESALKTLGLTEGTALGSLARRTIFKTLGYDKYQFYAKADERTCEQCGSLHGLIFPMSAYEVGVTASPIHPRCRCWEVPIRD